MANPTEHRTKAEELLAQARTYPPSSAARLATLTEANVEAILFLADLTAAVAAPVKFYPGPVEVAEGDYTASTGRLIPAEDTTDDTPTPKRRPRKATTAKVTAAGKSYGDLPAKEADK